jgi:hypothetical protein
MTNLSGEFHMNYRNKQGHVSARRRPAAIRTSIFELMQELSNLTADDNLVIAAMKSIFGAYNVRLAAAPVPLRLVNTDNPRWNSPKKRRRRRNSR